MNGAQALRLGLGFVLVQGAWFVAVIGAARGEAGFGIVVAAAVVGLLLVLGKRPGADLTLVALALAVGLAWDSLLGRAGLVDYASPGPWPGWAPAWILALWALLGAMLREPMRWLQARRLPAALLGGVGGASSYAAAARFGACSFPDPVLALAAIGTGWALILPLLLAAAQRLDRGALPTVAACGARA